MSRDPIASTTIARLYLAQGHVRKAGRMLDTLLRHDPRDGAALHLRERLRATRLPTLTAAVDETTLEVHWENVDETPRRHLMIVTFLATGTHPHIEVTSVPCKETAGSCTFERPQRPGSAVLSIGFVGSAGFVAEAVTAPLVWSLGE